MRHLYSAEKGRPALYPLVLFTLLLIGHLFGIRSERELMREVQCNAAYRWYLRLKLSDKVSDASILSQNSRRRFRDSAVYQKLFDEIVELAMKRGLVTGEVLYTDATHLKASANKNKFDVVRVEVKPVEYLAQLEQAIEEDRAEEGKRELKPRSSAPATKEIKVSRTDKDAGYMVARASRKGSSTWIHRTVDGSMPLLPTRMPRRQQCMIRCLTCDGAGPVTGAVCRIHPKFNPSFNLPAARFGGGNKKKRSAVQPNVRHGH